MPLEDSAIEKRPELHSYSNWFIKEFDYELGSVPESIYKHVTLRVLDDFNNSTFWKELLANITNYNDQYYANHEYDLLTSKEIPIEIKPYESVINKSYRKNILHNSNYPSEPSDGWVKPDNWFEKIKDILRTSITVKYLDGVQFLANKIKELAEKHNYSFEVDYEARDEGYYAAHITVKGSFNIVDENWISTAVMFPIEIQITTQLQEVIKGMLHKMYEEVRVQENTNSDKKWKWDYKSKEFSSNYLGHILHYVEGMILEVRDKQKNNNKNEKGI